MNNPDCFALNTHLHIVAFDIPFPANYGGVIDVFYKIRSLHHAGAKIHLHCFEYQREQTPELNSLCEEVNYYPRSSGLLPNLSARPYIVMTRRSEQLVLNLMKDEYPIIFEGIHTCYALDDERLRTRFRVYRESNIEHHYYYQLFCSEKQLIPRLFFLIESLRLHLFQQQLKHASLMLTVSEEDTTYLQKKFPGHIVFCLPSFHREDEVTCYPGRGNYAIYHGNLSVAENIRAAEFLIKKVWTETMPELVIAGLNPPKRLLDVASGVGNIRFVINPTDSEMYNLIHQAHLNILVTFQATGLKLKLLNALFNGRFCLVNPAMVKGTSLSDLCIIATEPEEFRYRILETFSIEFTSLEINRRVSILKKHYSNQKNCKLLSDLLNLF